MRQKNWWQNVYVLIDILQAKWNQKNTTIAHVAQFLLAYARKASVGMFSVHGLYSIDTWEHKLHTNVHDYHSNVGGGCLFHTPQILLHLFFSILTHSSHAFVTRREKWSALMSYPFPFPGPVFWYNVPFLSFYVSIALWSLPGVVSISIHMFVSCKGTSNAI